MTARAVTALHGDPEEEARKRPVVAFGPTFASSGEIVTPEAKASLRLRHGVTAYAAHTARKCEGIWSDLLTPGCLCEAVCGAP